VLGAGDINRLCPAIGTGLRGRPREEKKIVN
jgi:hypothetical protein